MCSKCCCAICAQAAQPAYMKTNSGRVLEMPKTEEGPTTQQEMEQLSATYQSSVRVSAVTQTHVLSGLLSGWQTFFGRLAAWSYSLIPCLHEPVPCRWYPRSCSSCANRICCRDANSVCRQGR